MKFFSFIVSGIAWPVAIVWITYQFKGELRALLNRVAQSKNQDFASKPETVLPKTQAIEKSASTIFPDQANNSKHEQLRRIAAISPREAIMEAWGLVEDAAEKFKHAQATSHENAQTLVAELVKAGKVPEGTEFLFNYMLSVRIQSEQLQNFNLSTIEALGYIDMAINMSALILSVE